jgi:DNA-binding NarL/FixJ family response regulator
MNDSGVSPVGLGQPARDLGKTRVLIADDHDIVRAGIRHLLAQQADIEVVGEASDGRGAVQLAEHLAPNVVIMDIAMPNLNGMEAASQILRRDHKVGVIILSMHEEEDYLMRALAVGVRGYLLKETAQTDLVPAVRMVATGKTYFSRPVEQMLADDFGKQMQQRGISDSYALLTEREREILQLIAEGKSNKEAAAVLGLSPYTVETHRTHIMQKLDLHNTAEIVLYAVRKKIIV